MYGLQMGWGWLDVPARIRIKNTETGEELTIAPDEDIPAGWIPVYGANTTETLPEAGTTPASRFPWVALVLVVILWVALSKG